ncbi:zinc finger protein 718-like [Ptychodera flava]|uniref:zinc finger protein 718-like n=1 Tax=Ptychodera flava TaxID=63121 RepID=UPI00396A4D80
MREKSHDLSPADTSQEVSSKTVDKNKQALEIFSTDLNNENERKTIKGQNQEAFADVSHDDGNFEPTADKSETCESSEDLANIPNTDTDKRLRAELSTKESNLEMNHRGHKFNAYPAITQMSKEPAAATTETQCLDTGAAASPDTNKSHHHKAGPSSDEELLPGAQSKTKSTGFKKTPSQKNKLKCQERLTRERNGTLHAELHMKEKEAKTLKLKREKKRKEKATKKFFKCEDCGIGFTLKKEYSLHMRIHKKDAQKRFQCRLCGTEFAKMIELTNHEKSVHPGEKPYVCEVCHHGFNNFMYLNGHITRAHGTTSFNCEDCDKVFKTKSALNLHSKRMHLGVWKYQCDTCSKNS